MYLPGGMYLPREGGTWPGTPPVNRMTDRCKNITLPQTSFTGGNYRVYILLIQEKKVTQIDNNVLLSHMNFI